MKRPVEHIRQHSRESSLSSLGSRSSLTTVDSAATPYMEGIRILSCSSPEIAAMIGYSGYVRSDSAPPILDHETLAPAAAAASSSYHRVTPKASNKQRQPLDDITGLAVSLNSIRLYPSPSSTLNVENKENIPPARRHNKPPKITLHRRVSFDMLPSPSEISGRQGCHRPSHRRTATLFTHSASH